MQTKINMCKYVFRCSAQAADCPSNQRHLDEFCHLVNPDVMIP